MSIDDYGMIGTTYLVTEAGDNLITEAGWAILIDGFEAQPIPTERIVRRRHLPPRTVVNSHQVAAVRRHPTARTSEVSR